MATNGRWEVVGKPSKKQKAGEEKEKKKKDIVKAFIEKMPKYEEPVALGGNSTGVFEALLEKERRDEERRQKQHEERSKKEQQQQQKEAKNNKKQPEKKQSAPKPKPYLHQEPKRQNNNTDQKKQVSDKTLDELLKRVTPKDVQTFLTKAQHRFAGAPNIWLKDTVTYFNEILNTDVNDIVYLHKAPEYPWRALHKEVQTLITGLLNQCSDHILQQFMEHCMHYLVLFVTQGEPFQGYMLMMQAVCLHKPSLVANSISKFVELRNGHQNRPQLCLAIMWVAGQAGIVDIKCAVKVWLDVMFPVIGMKTYSKFVLNYLENIFEIHSDWQSASDVLGLREFFPVLDVTFANSAKLLPPQQEQLVDLYNNLKTIAFGRSPDGSLWMFFPSFLRRLQTSSNPELKEEVQKCLVQCLASDVQSYKVWKQLYPKHLAHSAILLQYLSDNWSTVRKDMHVTKLKECVTSFKSVNTELESKGTKSQGLTECQKYSKELLSKMSVISFPWRFIFFSLLVGVLSYVTYDVNIHGSLRKSDTGKLLQNAGLLATTESVIAQGRVYYKQAYSWTSTNVPVYYNQTMVVVGPYLNNFWTVIYQYCLVAWNYLQPVRDYINQYMPKVLEWMSINIPIALNKLRYYTLVYGEKLFLFLGEYTILLWNMLLHYITVTGLWLQENVFTGDLSVDKLQEASWKAVGTVQQYSASAYDWIQQQVAAITAGSR